MIQFQAPVVQRVDNAIQRINSYPLGSATCFVNTYPLDSDLSVGLRYPPFEQLGPDKKTDKFAMQLSASIKKINLSAFLFINYIVVLRSFVA